jgi:lysophospholipase L1-like esterase
VRLRSTIPLAQADDFELQARNRLRRSRTATPLLAIGDSWLFDQWERDFGVVRPNLTNSLLKLGYRDNASSTTEFVSAGRAFGGMARPPFLKDVTNYLADEPDIEAILIGGGANDLVSGLPPPLYRMLKPPGAGENPLDEAEVSSFIDGALVSYYDTVIKTLAANTDIPILIHGYDHPIPDGRGDTLLIATSGPWLLPIFELRGYDLIHNSGHLTLAREVMQRVFDRLNAAVKKVAAAYPNRAFYVKLTGTLAEKFGAADKYQQLWRDELHPNEQGFDLLAARIAEQLKDLNVG